MRFGSMCSDRLADRIEITLESLKLCEVALRTALKANDPDAFIDGPDEPFATNIEGTFKLDRVIMDFLEQIAPCSCGNLRL